LGIYTCVQGKNADLIKNVCKLYAPKGSKIADVTWGKGAFWKKVSLDDYDFYGSDIKPDDRVEDKDFSKYPKNMLFETDFRALNYESNTFDVVVLDPPYVHNPGKMFVDNTYNNVATTKGFYHKDIMQLYFDGMIEARRILRQDGFLWVKCQDQIESGKQKWSHIEIYDFALEMGMYPKDLFVLHQEGKPAIQHKQQHARRNHSYLWVFQNT
jgi:tRNA G10  N-methylase Trm11